MEYIYLQANDWDTSSTSAFVKIDNLVCHF